MLNILISLLPVFIFLIALIYLDSFKLVRISPVAITILTGAAAALISYLLNTSILDNQLIELGFYTRYISPFIEESLKAFFVIYLLSKKKVGFMVDAAIYGFAAGAGFAFIENIYYLNLIEQSNLILWFIRGFGTAVMHGGTAAVFAIVTKSIIDRKNRFNVFYLLPGFLSAVIIHSFFNHFLFSPVLMTLLQLIVLPLIIVYVFHKSEIILKEWMETGMDNEVQLLEQINVGKVSETHVGEYLLSLQNNFSSKVVADILCYIKIHLELAIKAKGVLLMKEAGLPIIVDGETKEKFEEIKYLEKSIGQTGKMAVSPILHTTSYDLWQLYMLEKS